MRKFKLYQVLSLVLGCIFLNIVLFIPPLHALEALINDPQNDIHCAVANGTQIISNQYVGTHDEIDIVKLEISGQIINVTFADNISNWEIYYEFFPFKDTYARIVLIENPSGSYLSRQLLGPGYIVGCRNWSSIYQHPDLGLEAFLMYFPNGESSNGYHWNGTSWFAVGSNNLNASQPIGIFVNNVIQLTIPPDAFEITENFTHYVFTQHHYIENNLVFIYNDYLPNLLIFPPQNNIPGYHLLIILAPLVGVYIFILSKFVRRNRSKL